MTARALFFDMDGTLIDSEAGIVACVQYALVHSGRPEPTPAQVKPWIGPPLKDTFDQLFGGDAAAADRAVALYKQRYDAEGWRSCRLYPGIAAALGVDGLFDTIVGTSEDGRLRHKPDLVAEALRRLALAPAQAVMIGDRRMDVDGARANGMDCIGVLWGFGGADELRAAGARTLVASPAELVDALGG
ncbi:HAD hydrolase-like protein [Xanthomonas massiliensis]|uniref:HAD hydrolase-like protein n=1 Tax=Xanthomonas massiliensis TaxID=1720302 RepID=UPI000826EB97|nr:HAD hydrolase-like protein [Xanthomonas massiliensis]